MVIPSTVRNQETKNAEYAVFSSEIGLLMGLFVLTRNELVHTADGYTELLRQIKRTLAS
jgi:hypothetical protein